VKLNPLGISSIFILSTLAGCFTGPASPVKPGTQGIKSKITPTRPILQLQQVNVLDQSHPTVSNGPGSSPSIQVIAKVTQETLLSQEFLYGADLQYSSNFESTLELYSQSMAIGHVPTHFKIAGDELRLVADNKVLFPSDVNHPEQLISRFKILSRTPEADGTTTLTISGANSTVALSSIFGKSVQSGSDDPVPVTDSWIRSFEFIPDGNYILQQTSITLADGTLAEFMESIFPAKTLEAGSQFKKFKMDPTDPVGASTGPVKRYRMLGAETIFEDEEKVAYAQHFDLSPKADGSPATIDFYVTPNIPDTYLEAVKNGVEGWNRYFLSFKEFQRPVMQFKGKLPDGIHLGDPRYNVIAWDNRRVAGAAYETQASDPRTGKQSHTLIYLPAAWVKIGNDYWKGGKFSEPAGDALSQFTNKKNRKGLLKKMPRCDRDIHEIGELVRSGRLSKDEAKVFGIQTLTQTLFHEVGHSLGLAHNFKGSLSYKPSDPKSLFATSIMDYSDYEIERQAYDSVHTSQGPLLEYDRQIISTIYNQGKDVSDSDPVLPACADAEADWQTGGVDPLCNRYDVENDPTHSIITAMTRFTMPSMPRDTTLTQALTRLGQDFADPSIIAGLKTTEDFDKYADELKETLSASIQYYLFSGKASVTRTLITNVKALLQFLPKILPEEYDEAKFRGQALAGLMEFLKMETLPPEVTKALVLMTPQLMSAVSKAPVLADRDAQQQSKMAEKIAESILGLLKTFKLDPESGLPRAQASVLASLKKRKAPYFLGPLGGGILDVESIITNALYRGLSDSDNSTLVRVAAASSLTSFKGRSPMTDQIIKTATIAIQQQRDMARVNPEREEALTLLKILEGNQNPMMLILKR